METFLHEVALRILKDNPDDMDQVLVVFNNRRPGLFLHREIAREGNGKAAFFFPKTAGMDDLVSEMSSLEIVPREFLLFELYDIHRQICTDEYKDQTFEDFISFGEMMMNDFSEIDLYRIDAAQLFNNLGELKAIGEWDLEDPHMNAFQRRYLHFYNSLYQYYTLLHARLLAQGKAYSGMAYREVADHIEEQVARLNYKSVYFVGFSVLSACESEIIKTCVRGGIGHLVADGDSYYVNDDNHEAGRFLRELKALSPEPLQFPSNLVEDRKHLHLVSCPENLMQAKYAGNLLEQALASDDGGDGAAEASAQAATAPSDAVGDRVGYDGNTHGTRGLDGTCLVLADEDLLLPMLNSLPSQVKRANITMGLPFTYSDAHALLLRLLQMYKSVRGQKFYQRDLLDFLSDYNIGLLLGEDNLYAKALNYLAANTLVYLDAEQIVAMFSSIHVSEEPVKFLFVPCETASRLSGAVMDAGVAVSDGEARRIVKDKDLLQEACSMEDSDGTKKEDGTKEAAPYADPSYFLQNSKLLITRLSQVKTVHDDAEERETLACGYEIIDYLDSLQKTYHYIETLNTLEKIYLRLSQRHNIAFYGEPLEGLQILGVLETRCLDFDRMIILSVNEGVIPSGKSSNTLIPYALKRAYGIPTFAERDAVYAYHFYRMLQRANDITLVYHTATDSAGKGEPSRFIKQITSELLRANPNIVLDKKIISADSSTVQMQSTPPVEKSEAIMTQLHEHAQRGFSPSALNVYHLCPMQFYYQYVLHVHEETDVEEDIEAAELGTIIHDILHDIYTTDADNKIRISTLKRALEGVDALVDDKFAGKYQRGRSAEGRNYYYRSIAKRQIAELLKKEINILEQGSSIQMMQAEEELSAPLTLHLSDGDATVLIVGKADRIDKKADRIDKRDGQLRVIDYKTGKVTPTELSYNKDFEAGEVSDMTFSGKWFQVMTYAWLYLQRHDKEKVISGIYPLNNLKDPFLAVQWKDDSHPDGPTSNFDKQVSERFQRLLQDMVGELMDRNSPFHTTPSSKACTYCLFRDICGDAK